jgi:signal transduction histidine kinase
MAIQDRTLRRLAWAVFVAAALGLVSSVFLDAASGHSSDPVFGAIVFTFPLVGLVVLTRRPRNRLGWLMLSMGGFFVLPFESYGAYAITTDGWPLGPLALAFASPSWVPFIGISGFLLLLFPDGHLPSRRWRWFGWLCGIGLVTLFLLILVAPGEVDVVGISGVENPIGIEAIGRALGGRDGGGIYAFVLFAPLTVLGGAIAVITRRRRSADPIERQQLRWLAYAAAVIATLYVMVFVLVAILGLEEGSAWNDAMGSIAAISFVLIPISIGIAILRYRLYDIDVVIRKTVLITVMAGAIGAVYVGVVAGVGAMVGSRSSPLVSALAAAIVALVFQPVRSWGRRVADRVVYGKRATPYEVMSTFGDQLAGTYAADDVLPRMARVLGEGVGAARADVLLLIDGALRGVASWPQDAAAAPPDRTVEVRHGGEVLGALQVAMPASDPLDPTRDALIDDLAAHAGLVLRNVRLTEDLRARLVDLQAAQRRLVTAQDEERRRLERNIHDGAQQQLVALAVKARLARTLTDRDPAKAVELLQQIETETQEALEDLRDLARGIYPPLLADKGLGPALDSQARKASIAVTVQSDGTARYPQDVEAAVYFSVLEALQNTAKYAHASNATVRLASDDGALTFEVTDDGRGFDPTANGYGTGLQGIADRLAALGGALDVRSAPGSGTTVTGRIPVTVRSVP